MDKEKFQDWAEQLEASQIIAIAEAWGVSLANDIAEGKTAHLETFNQYLQREFAANEADIDEWQYDNLKQSGDL